MYCPHCGEVVKVGAHFCNHCGRSVKDKDSGLASSADQPWTIKSAPPPRPPSPPVPKPPTPPPAPPAPPPVPTTSSPPMEQLEMTDILSSSPSPPLESPPVRGPTPTPETQPLKSAPPHHVQPPHSAAPKHGPGWTPTDWRGSFIPTRKPLPSGVVFTAVVYLLAGVVYLLFALVGWMGYNDTQGFHAASQSRQDMISAILIYLFVAAGIIATTVAIGLLALKPWARRAATILTAVGALAAIPLLAFPAMGDFLWLGLNGFILYQLNRADTARAFRR